MTFKSKFIPPQYWEDIDNIVREGRFLEPFADFWGVNTPEFNAIRKADELGEAVHYGDVRVANGDPYIFHPRRAALAIAVRLGIWGPYITVAAILHDTVEDHKDMLTFQDIALDYGALSSIIVGGLTKPEKMGLEEYPDVHSRAKAHKVKAAGDTAIIVKGYENNDNLLTLPNNKEFHERQLRETERYILPMTRREPILYKDLQHTIELRRAYLNHYL